MVGHEIVAVSASLAVIVPAGILDKKVFTKHEFGACI